MKEQMAKQIKTYFKKAKDETECHLYSPMFTTVSDDVNKIRRREIGERTGITEEKVILMVGATGSGKSTLINAFYNYLSGVEWTDDFRLKLVEEETHKSQAKSQTEWITAYTIHHQPWFKIPYTLKIVDTPGFGDTEGMERDEKIRAQIEHGFKIKGGIDQIDAVGFVAPSTEARLTATQSYIFDSTLEIFGNDVKDNIFMLLTYSEVEKVPPVLHGLKAANISFNNYFKFNNASLYSDPKQQQDADSYSVLGKGFWELGMESFGSFMGVLNKVQPRTLILSKEVLQERRDLKSKLNKIQKGIFSGLYRMGELHVEEDELRTHRQSIDFTYKVLERSEEEHIPPREVVKHSKDLQKRYAQDEDTDLTAEKLIASCQKDLNRKRDETFRATMEAREHIATLEKIALRPNPMSAVDYINVLITREKFQNFPGSEQRIQQLLVIRNKAQIYQVIYEPWKTGREKQEGSVSSLVSLCQAQGIQYYPFETVMMVLSRFNSPCPMTIGTEETQSLGTVSRGEARILQGPDSDVSLKIPKGSRGIYISKVHMGSSKFKSAFPENESLIGPLVEFEHLNKGSEVTESGMENLYEIQIPHCLKSTKLWKNVRVRCLNVKAGPFTEVHLKDEEQRDMFYEINKRFITISTRHFCKFVSSTSGNYNDIFLLKLFLFGKLRFSNPSQTTSMHTRMFMCNQLYSIDDYKNRLKRMNKDLNLNLFEAKTLPVDEDNFDPKQTHVSLSMTATDAGTEKWEPNPLQHPLWNKETRSFTQNRKRLEAVMQIGGPDDRKIDDPFEAITVDMKIGGYREEFEGTMNITLHTEEKDIHEPIPYCITDESSTSRNTTREPQVDRTKLREADLFLVSRKITNDSMFNKLGLALDLTLNELPSIRTNCPNDINEAALKMLQTWLEKQSNTSAARQGLINALDKAEFKLIISEVFNI